MVDNSTEGCSAGVVLVLLIQLNFLSLRGQASLRSLSFPLLFAAPCCSVWLRFALQIKLSLLLSFSFALRLVSTSGSIQQSDSSRNCDHVLDPVECCVDMIGSSNPSSTSNRNSSRGVHADFDYKLHLQVFRHCSSSLRFGCG